jgi:lipopolysaccharide transport system permease protein
MDSVTYEPDNSIKRGYRGIFREIWQEISGNRWLTWQLFKRDFFATYKQSFFGVFWAFIVPLVSIGTFIALNRSGVFSTGDINVPYPLYAILGMSFWQLFSTGIIACSDSLVKAGQMLTKINFSKKSLIFAAFGQSLISFSLQLILVVILFVHYRITPDWSVIFIPFLIIPLLLLTCGLGFLFSLINGVTRDIGNILPMFITFFMFLTPVLYAKTPQGVLYYVTRFNPMYYFVSAPRELALSGSLQEPRGFLISSILALVIFIFGLIAFHLTETRIAERI